MTQAPPIGLGWARLADVDPELWDAMLLERDRQRDKIELIASENYTFAAVMEAQGSWLTNKYAEGLPGKRYYGGCEYVDIAETLAQQRGSLSSHAGQARRSEAAVDGVRRDRAIAPDDGARAGAVDDGRRRTAGRRPAIEDQVHGRAEQPLDLVRGARLRLAGAVR